MKEKAIENRLIREVTNAGGMCIKFPPLFFAGFPDRLVFMPRGVLVLVELKAPGKKPGPLQVKVHAKLRALGFRVEVIDSYEQIDALMITL